MFHELARDDVFRLETRRLWLRWPQARDAPALAALANHWDVARLTAFLPHPYALDDAERFIALSRAANAQGERLRLVLTLKSGDRAPIGLIGIDIVDGRPELGFWLGRDFWGQGFASEAVAAMTMAFFRIAPADGLSALALEENLGSRAVLARTGFKAAGREAARGRHGETPALLFALSRADWSAAAQNLRCGGASATA